MSGRYGSVFSGNASSSWQAILYGLELLKKGPIWRVGNGQSIRIWRDPWIPRPPSFKLISPKRRCRLRFVSELIDHHGVWKLDVLNQYFLPMDISEIVKLRPYPRALDDCLAWAPEKSGSFSVRSAYHIAMDEVWSPSSTSSSLAPDGSRDLWKLIRKSNVPPTVQTFAWRLCTDSLPMWRNKYFSYKPHYTTRPSGLSASRRWFWLAGFTSGRPFYGAGDFTVVGLSLHLSLIFQWMTAGPPLPAGPDLWCAARVSSVRNEKRDGQQRSHLVKT